MACFPVDHVPHTRTALWSTVSPPSPQAFARYRKVTTPRPLAQRGVAMIVIPPSCQLAPSNQETTSELTPGKNQVRDCTRSRSSVTRDESHSERSVCHEENWSQSLTELRRTVKRMRGCSSCEVDDVVQEVALRALRQSTINTHSSGKVNAWFRGIARNIIRERRRSQHETAFSDLYDFDARSVVANQDCVEQNLERAEAQIMIGRALAAIPVHHQQIISIRFWEGNSVPRIAMQLKMSTPAAESLLKRALKALANHREALRKHGLV